MSKLSEKFLVSKIINQNKPLFIMYFVISFYLSMLHYQESGKKCL